MKDEQKVQKEEPKTFDYQAAQACTRKNAEAEKIDIASL